MRHFFLFLMKFLPIRKLGPDGALFHRGFVFRTKWLRVFIHRFLMSDPDVELHNHPFKWSFSIILWGSYVERRLVDGKVVKKEYGPGSRNVIRSSDFHSVSLSSSEVFTLFIAGQKNLDEKGKPIWGFKDPNTLVYETHQDFFKRKGAKPTQDTDDID